MKDEQFVDLGQSSKPMPDTDKWYPRLSIDEDKLPGLAGKEIGYECVARVQLRLVGKEDNHGGKTLSIELRGILPEDHEKSDSDYNPAIEMLKNAARLPGRVHDDKQAY